MGVPKSPLPSNLQNHSGTKKEEGKQLSSEKIAAVFQTATVIRISPLISPPLGSPL